MKRFYRDVAVTAVSVRAGSGSFGILLDLKAVKTPAAELFAVPTRALADAIAEEWRMQEERVLPTTMPLMQMAATAIDGVRKARETTIEDLLRYLESDVLCYRAASPPELAARQAALSDPWLSWFQKDTGIGLAATTELVARPADGAKALLRPRLLAMDDFRLVGLQVAAGLTGSIVLALSMAKGVIDARDAYAAAEVEAVWQAEKWGADAEAEARRTNLQAELAAVQRFFVALKQL
ncbi:ATP12 family protein [Candidatus Raskinella chloraquaticus]|uniref:ATPase n=1 Tax=Candidatus Raskinella chloraquaticus TaxID=1951219 RepID=A0A1W9I501_9HYPH|nr:MAG: hypothetical protein A4S15_03505 [Proteobacteria bacterium SG_bin8]